MAEFKVGDTVQLKSGSRVMTIVRIIGDNPGDDRYKMTQGLKDGDIVCNWYEDGDIKEKGFPPASLKIYRDSDDEPVY